MEYIQNKTKMTTAKGIDSIHWERKKELEALYQQEKNKPEYIVAGSAIISQFSLPD